MTFYFIILSNSSIKESNNSIASSTGFGLAISTPAMRNNSTGDFVHPPFKKDKHRYRLVFHEAISVIEP